MTQMQQAMLDKIYKELKAIRADIHKLEYAVIPVEKLSPEEHKAHVKDLEDAVKGDRVNFREL